MSLSVGERSVPLGAVSWLESRVRQLTGVDVGCDPDRTLEGFGLDSLQILELTTAIEQDWGISHLPAERLMGHTIRSLARCLAASDAEEAGERSRSRFGRMRADGRLPDDVVPARPVAPVAPGRVLLTGATGFLGRHLLRSFLESPGVEVWCLLRGRPDQASDRIRRGLRQSGLRERGWTGRLHAIEGDLSQPYLGISPAAFEDLSTTIDTIYHCGAGVNWVVPYETLRAVNVRATLDLLRLAAAGRPKRFHFISTQAVCYPVRMTGAIERASMPVPDPEDLSLGYAQSKCIAEQLVMQAASRGLGATIYRPSLITGNSETGFSNRGDLLSTFLRGCIEMGVAPDLDWVLDCCPVDYAAGAIVGVSKKADPAGVLQIANARPRRWSECVLWLNLYGYRVRLVSYAVWLERLERRALGPTHPLRPLLGFFRHRVEEAGCYLPEIYTRERWARIEMDRSRQTLESVGGPCPPLSAGLLGLYFDRFVEQGFLPPPALWQRSRARKSHDQDWTRRLESAGAWPSGSVRRYQRLDLNTRDSIVSELTGWKRRGAAGLRRYRVHFRKDADAIDVVVKVKPEDRAVVDLGVRMAHAASERLGQAFARHAGSTGLVGSQMREHAIYSRAGRDFSRYLPSLLGSSFDPVEGSSVLVLEDIGDALLMDSVETPDRWESVHIEAALEGIARLHGVWYGRGAALRRRDWIGPVHTARSMAEATPLWAALADHAGGFFERWAGPGMSRAQQELIDDLERWWTQIDRLPSTLIHNDFNPRNLALRRLEDGFRLCAYDWELATCGLPQHDVAEFLCFVLSAGAGAEEVEHFSEVHRTALERSAGVVVSRRAWEHGFRLALYDLLVNRLSMYALIGRFRSQPYLPRVVRTWKTLYDLFPYAGLEAA